MCPCSGRHVCGYHAAEIRRRHAEVMACPRYLRKLALEDLIDEYGAERVAAAIDPARTA